MIMNADGHPAVAADLQAEVTLPWFALTTKRAFFGGLGLLAIGAVLILIGASVARRPAKT